MGVRIREPRTARNPLISPVVPTPSDRTAHCSQDPQDDADRQQDDPDGPQNAEPSHETHDEENDSESDHDKPPNMECSLCMKSTHQISADSRISHG
jgi:hypothetical protein